MLSYQHIYHAGNLADVHKHAALAWMLDYMTQKPKPLSYLETHAGRGLYDLTSDAARKTGEAAQGIARAEALFAAGHPYRRALETVRAGRPNGVYPGSPAIARALLRAQDVMHLAELHPGEHAALKEAMRGSGAHLYHQDGFAMAQSVAPPTPRRGLLVVDPSYELRQDYQTLPRFFSKMQAKWNVGVLVLWYPLLRDPAHEGMVTALHSDHPDALRHEVRFPPARDGHRMIGSGLFVTRPPFGLDAALQEISDVFARLAQG